MWHDSMAMWQCNLGISRNALWSQVYNSVKCWRSWRHLNRKASPQFAVHWFPLCCAGTSLQRTKMQQEELPAHCYAWRSLIRLCSQSICRDAARRAAGAKCFAQPFCEVSLNSRVTGLTSLICPVWDSGGLYAGQVAGKGQPQHTGKGQCTVLLSSYFPSILYFLCPFASSGMPQDRKSSQSVQGNRRRLL